MANPKFKQVIYPSQNSANKAHRPASGAYDVYIPGVNIKKQMLTESQIKELVGKTGAVMRGHGSFRHTPSGDIIFRSANLADINTAAETAIGWHVERVTPKIRAGSKAYVIPTYGCMKDNAADGVFPVITYDITDEPQKP